MTGGRAGQRHPHDKAPSSAHMGTDGQVVPGSWALSAVSSAAPTDEPRYDGGEEELLSEALLAVSSAEEYAAKIIKLQQACLTPLKEDLADWLNKIMNTTTITSQNFMDKLDNGVIICKLAKVISNWCEQQRQTNQEQAQNRNRALSKTYQKAQNSLNYSASHVPNTLNPQLTNHTAQQQSQPSHTTTNNKLSKASSLSASHLTLNSNEGILRIDQTKIWDDAKSRTFYARDNVCNFIRWSKDFGVNQSLLFESDDLVLHTNTRQVVLCLLDVARIACVKHGFTEAPGLIKFEQEIDRELEADRATSVAINHSICDVGGAQRRLDGSDDDRRQLKPQNGLNGQEKHTGRASRLVGSLGDATDDLIMRYCIHKKAEAARKKVAEAEAEAAAAAAALAALSQVDRLDGPSLVESQTTNGEQHLSSLAGDKEAAVANATLKSTPSNNLNTLVSGSNANKNASLSYENRVDSLDSGEGRTESASTSHSRTPVNTLSPSKAHDDTGSPTFETVHPADNTANSAGANDIPSATATSNKRRTNSNLSLADSQSSGLTTSDVGLSSSRSSLLSGEGESCSTKLGAVSDLDGKVMRIAKSYYGKGVTKDVTRLSEGKYRIADRIVFVRLLKGHRVMVRIGGGWDTLENFLFRHKSDPSQVIDVDNLLPLETKMNFEHTGPQMMTPSHGRTPRTPQYRRGNAISSKNLSISNYSLSNISAISRQQPRAHSRTRHNLYDHGRNPSVSLHGTPLRQPRSINDIHKPAPYLLIQRDQQQNTTNQTNANAGQSTLIDRNQQGDSTPIKASSVRNTHNQAWSTSKIPTASTSNLHPLITRIPINTTNLGTVRNTARMSSTTNLHNGLQDKRETPRKLGRSNDSLSVIQRTNPRPQRAQLQKQIQRNHNSKPAAKHNNGSAPINGNLRRESKIEAHRKSSTAI